MLGPTLLIDDKVSGRKENFQKQDKSEIDRLLDSDEDSPRFGK